MVGASAQPGGTMAEPRAIILSLVERGWQAARECSLDLHGKGICVVHMIKGSVSPQVLALMVPKSHIHFVSVSRTLFWPAALGMFGWFVASGTLRAVLVDNERSRRRLSRWVRVARVQLLLVRQGQGGYEMIAADQRVMPSTWHETLRHPCGSH